MAERPTVKNDRMQKNAVDGADFCARPVPPRPFNEAGKIKKPFLPWRALAAALMGLALAGTAAGNEETMKKADPQIQEYTLSNGLRLLTKEVRAVPVVSVFIWYKVGSRNEEPGQSGLAHFLEHMLFKGTQKFPKGEIARRVSRTGGEQNAFTSYDYTAYFETLPSEYLELALEIEADRMRNSILDPAEMEKERTVILSELEGNRNHPQVRLRDLVNAQTWIHHPYRRPVIGWREEVEKLTHDQLKAFYQRYYRPDNATLVIVGDFDPKKLKPAVDRWFGALPKGVPLPAFSLPQETQQGERRALLRDYGQAALIRAQIEIPAAGHPDHFALTVLNDALTNGKSSRLYRALVDKGLAAEVSSSPQEMIDKGVWVFSAVCQQGVDPQKVEAALRAEMTRMMREPLLEREFQRSVNQTRARLIFAKDSLTDQAMMLGYYQTVAGNWRLLDRYPENVAAVTPTQLQAAAEKYLSPDRLTLGVFEPLPGSQPGPLPAVPAGNALSLLPRRLPAERLGELPQVPGAKTPGGGAAAEFEAKNRRYVLSNGLILLVQPNHNNPTLNLSGLVRAGLASEPADLPGLAFVHAQMLDRGTAKRTAAQLADDLEFKAASLEYSVGLEEMNLSGAALSEDLDLLLTAAAETLREPNFPVQELEKVRKETLTLCRMLQDNSQSQAWKGFAALAYPPGHPMTRSLLTAEPGVLKLKRQDLLDYHRRWIRPDALILSIAGDVDPEAVRRRVEALFGDWSARGERPRSEAAPMAPVTEIRTTVTEIPGKREAITIMGHQGIFRKDPEYYQAYVANQVLGGAGLSSQLMRTVRDRDGLTYSIYSQFRLAHGERPWYVLFQSHPDKVALAVETVCAQIRDLQGGKVREQDVDDAREELVGGLFLSLETNQGIAYLNREVEYHELGKDYLVQYPLAVRAVTREKMIAAACKWFHPDRYLLSTVRPPAGETGGPGK